MKMKIKWWGDYIGEALGAAAKLSAKDIEFKDMPKWIKFRIRLFNFECDLTGGPKRWWTKFTLWRFYKKYPGLKD